MTPPEAGGWHGAFGYPCVCLAQQPIRGCSGIPQREQKGLGPAAPGLVGRVAGRQVLG